MRCCLVTSIMTTETVRASYEEVAKTDKDLCIFDILAIDDVVRIRKSETIKNVEDILVIDRLEIKNN